MTGTSPKTSPTRGNLPPAVEARGATATRGGRTIWSEATFTIPRGTITVILGANGSGKTTLLDMELGFLKPAAGEIMVLGEPAGRANLRIGYVPQNYLDDMDTTVTVEQSVLLGLTGTRWGFHRTSSEERRAARRAVEFVGLAGRERLRLSELSGGLRQRVAIAQALVSSPELLVLDEPLANLDVTSQSAAVDLFARLNRELGMGVEIVSHDLTMLLPVVENAVCIMEGRVCCLPVERVLDADLLSRLYGTRMEVVRLGDGDVFVTPCVRRGSVLSGEMEERRVAR